MMTRTGKFIFLIAFVSLFSSCARLKKALSLCDGFKKRCDGPLMSFKRSRSSSHTTPTFSAASLSNPSSVPTRKGFGLETIYYKTPSFSIVTGTGLVGAAISTFAPEDTFFGPAPLEKRSEFTERRSETKEKFETDNKIANLGIKVFGDKRNTYSLNIGTMLRYHSKNKTLNFGGGTSLQFGAFHAGLSIYNEDYYQEKDQVDVNQGDGKGYQTIDVANVKAKTTTTVATAGINLGVISMDYTLIKRKFNSFDSIPNSSFDVNSFMESQTQDVQIYSFNFVLGRSILIYGYRSEFNFRPSYDRDNKEFSVSDRDQNEHFFGLQYQIGSNLILGVFNNYHLHQETSFALTIFI